MTTISIPPDLEAALTREAAKRGVTAESLALDSLRQQFASAGEGAETQARGTLFDALTGYIGAVQGPTEAWSECCGQRFAEGLAETQKQGRP
jgi:hypothetical protein